MSKHSKWAKVKNQKGGVDAKRAASFTKLGRVITVAAQEGGGDPNFNFKLRTAIDRALAANMPKDNIERAIKKGTGADSGAAIEEITYEGFAPGGIGVIVTALTDNRNRTVANVKFAFTSRGGSLGATGSVAWMFEKKAVIRLAAARVSEEAELALIEAGADDIATEDGETIVTSPVEALAKCRDAATAAGLKVESAEIEWVFKEDAPEVDDTAMDDVMDLLNALDEDDDVQKVYSAVGSV